MYSFHTDKARYFDMQRRVSAEHIVPMVAAHLPQDRPWRVLEVGCAEAGVLQAFVELGHEATGIELEDTRAELARGFLREAIEQQVARVVTADIYEVEPTELEARGFDLIILKDVIEHLPEQERMVPRLMEFLAPDGVMFFGFPPWMMPFGGHQQIARKRAVAMVPWLHLLPAPLYRGYLRAAGERTKIREELVSIRSTRITIERFERIAGRSGLAVLARRLWRFNPIYAHKFGLRPRTQLFGLDRLPVLRNFVTTAAYYVVGRADLQAFAKTAH